MKFTINHISKYKKGTNQYAKKPRGFQFKGYKEVAVICLILIPVVYFGNKVQGEQKGKFISPIPENSYANTIKPEEQKMPELAPLPERERNIQLIKWVFGKDSEQAIKVFTCESGLRSKAMNWGNSDHYPDAGIAQIHVTSSSPFTWQEMQNPIANLYQAKTLFDNRGWQPWDSSKHCWGSL